MKLVRKRVYSLFFVWFEIDFIRYFGCVWMQTAIPTCVWMKNACVEIENTIEEGQRDVLFLFLLARSHRMHASNLLVIVRCD